SASKVAWSADGKLIATGGSGDIHVTDAATGRLVRSLTGHTGRIAGLAFAADGRLTSCGGDGTAREWDVTTGQAREQIGSAEEFAGGLRGLGLSADGRTLASVNGQQIVVWTKPAQKRLWPVGAVNLLSDVALSPDGKTIAVA